MTDKGLLINIDMVESKIAEANVILNKIGFPVDYIHIDAEAFAVLMKDEQHRNAVKTSLDTSLEYNYHARVPYKSINLMACSSTPEELGLTEADFRKVDADVN